MEHQKEEVPVPLTPENAELLANVDLRQISVKKIGDRYYNDTVFKQWGLQV